MGRSSPKENGSQSSTIDGRGYVVPKWSKRKTERHRLKSSVRKSTSPTSHSEWSETLRHPGNHITPSKPHSAFPNPPPRPTSDRTSLPSTASKRPTSARTTIYLPTNALTLDGRGNAKSTSVPSSGWSSLSTTPRPSKTWPKLNARNGRSG